MDIPKGNQTGSVLTFSIEANGVEIPAEIQVISIGIERKFNTVPSARIVVSDGEVSTGSFDVSSSNTFVPGALVTIHAGHNGNNNVLFSGVVTAQSIRIDKNTGPVLMVDCNDEVIRMTVGHKNNIFLNQSDSSLIAATIESYPNMAADVKATTTIWPQQVQNYTTDWGFIVARAEANGFIINTLNGKVFVTEPDATPLPVLTVAYGSSLLEFNATLNALTQLANVTASNWNFETQAVDAATVPNNFTGPGNIPSRELAKVVDAADNELQVTVPGDVTMLKSRANTQAKKSELSKIQGTLKFQGSSLVNPGNYISLQNVGDRFNGNHLVSAVKHTLADGNWLTEAAIGLPSNWFIEPQVYTSTAGTTGLFTGVVKKIFDDPDGQYRILVEIPLFNPNGEGVWARLSNFYATNSAGVFFLPEVSDEVIVGFINEDAGSPVILGSVYSSTQNKPYSTLQPSENNALKAIVSKSGISLQFDDANKVFSIETPNKNTIILSDKDKKISITDENQNSITMSDSGIAIKSSKNISLEADQNIVLKGPQGIQLAACAGDVAISGINIKETADAQYSARGGETANVSSGMELTLKSAMVMIN